MDSRHTTAYGYPLTNQPLKQAQHLCSGQKKSRWRNRVQQLSSDLNLVYPTGSRHRVSPIEQFQRLMNFTANVREGRPGFFQLGTGLFAILGLQGISFLGVLCL